MSRSSTCEEVKNINLCLDLSSYAVKVFSETRKFLLEIPVKKGAEDGRQNRSLRNADSLTIVTLSNLEEIG